MAKIGKHSPWCMDRGPETTVAVIANESTRGEYDKGPGWMAHLKKISEQLWVLLQIESNGLVVDLSIGNLHGNVLELHVLPCNGGVTHHDQCCIVVLVVLDVQEHQLLPVMVLLACLDEAWDIDARTEQLQVLHQFLCLVLRIQNACTDVPHPLAEAGIELPPNPWVTSSKTPSSTEKGRKTKRIC